MQPATLERIIAGDLPKGDVLAVARMAGIMAAKQTASLIPLCHPLPLDSVVVTLERDGSRHFAHRSRRHRDRQDRRRDGSARRGERRRPHRLRHVQGGRPRDGARRGGAAREERRPQRHAIAGSSRRDISARSAARASRIPPLSLRDRPRACSLAPHEPDSRLSRLWSRRRPSRASRTKRRRSAERHRAARAGARHRSPRKRRCDGDGGTLARALRDGAAHRRRVGCRAGVAARGRARARGDA